MTKNENYWDKDKVYISDVKLEFYDGQDQSKLEIIRWKCSSLAKLFPTGSGYSEQAKEFKDEITYTPQDAASTSLVPTSTVNLTNTLLRRPMKKTIY